MKQSDIPYTNSINITSSNKPEITWWDTIKSINDRLPETQQGAILLPIYRHVELANLLEYPIATIIHEN